MFRSLFYKLGVTLKRQLINGESSSSSSFASTAKYYFFTSQNQNVLIKNSRVTTIYPSFSTAVAAASNDRVKRVMVNVELFRNEGVPEANISEYLILHPKSFTANRFVEILRKVKGMGFDHLESTFLKAVHMLTIMSEASWRNKMDVYKTCGGWTEDQIQSALRKDPGCMKASEKKIMAVMDFLVNEMSYDSSIVAENPIVFCCSLEDKIIPRCSVIRVLVSRGLIKENISLGTLATLVDESFLEKFVTKYEQEVPGLMKVFEGKLNYQKLLQK
ncbi:uncharacterized protein LOC113321654 [Papaver somniferum]|uniref:uncharacterized protein LOC113321654 n=1 Tax=Papaver somniferum TaxID=3469 RepID=UPI000E6F77F8|nr:uncharacterized protein LOC113321654 [Papaver somniferum]